jgi:hypothetical protein
MKDHSLKAWLTPWKEKPIHDASVSLFIVGWIAFLAFVGLSGPPLDCPNRPAEQ